jgi:hypothetical protein
MIFEIRKPQNENEFVNLYATVSETIRATDKDLPEYFLEPNIMDDREFEEIINMFRDYYELDRDMELEVIRDTADMWSVSVVPK